MLVKLSIEEFSRVLGSNAPAPGGGSVAALSGALGADLVSMVCRLSIGRKEYEQFNSTLTESLEKSEDSVKQPIEKNRFGYGSIQRRNGRFQTPERNRRRQEEENGGDLVRL